MKKKKQDTSTLLLIAILFAGLSLLLYPSVSAYWNSFTHSKAIASYVDEVSKLDQKNYDQYWDDAHSYSQLLTRRSNPFVLDDQMAERYAGALNISGNGIMGYVEIPSLDCSLPIYHGTDEAVLQIAVGHLEWTSLPVGGASTHCVISGHRGLPSARLFTDLDRLVVGDIFMLRVLDEILTYEVDQILIVEPNITEPLQITEGEDYCTMVTCTPYGVNSHRLLVRGHRIENIKEAKIVRVTANAIQIEPLFVAPVVAVPLLLVLLFALLLPKRRKYEGDDDD